VISYEISFFFILFCPLLLYRGYNINFKAGNFLMMVVLLMVVMIRWLVTCLAETNRAPFDFAEGERELVSGFKVEYGALQFGFLYIGEYGRILLLRYIRVVMFVCGGMLINRVLINCVVVFFIWVRATLPRFRYDLLMGYVWVGILPRVILVLLMLMVL
jgi:NADH-ubiquinone oxidoreductase chain 1